jgi:hypothetical protein
LSCPIFLWKIGNGSGIIRPIVVKFQMMDGMIQNSFYENGDYIFSIDRKAFLNSKS